MTVSEDRLQVLMPRALKEALRRAARRSGLSAGEYVRRLVETELTKAETRAATVPFPFGDDPVRTGRKRGSVDHDRPGR